MSDYSKSYDGAAKDAAEATIAGSDFDTEFSSIETAIATKANKITSATSNAIVKQTATGDIADSGVPIAYIENVTSDIQAQIDAIPTVEPFKGAFVYNSTNQSVGSTLAFNSEVYDTSSIHNNSTNNSRLTVPSGVSRVKLVGSVETNASASTWLFLRILKNGGATLFGHPGMKIVPISSVNNLLNISSAVVSVSPGDYFELGVYSSASSETVYGGATSYNTWFAMEVVE